MKSLRRYLEKEYKERVLDISKDCVPHEDLASYASGVLPSEKRKEIESHIADCYHCLDVVVSIHDAGKRFGRKESYIKREHIFLLLTMLSFALSFIFSRYFLQFLAATMIFGIKWIVDSKTTKTLVMIKESRKEFREPHVKKASRGPIAKKRTNFEDFL